MTKVSTDAKVKFPIEAGNILSFARAIGDPNPIYFDETYAATSEPGHVILPPTFTSSSVNFNPDFSLRPKIGEVWMGSGRESSGVSTSPNQTRETVLHAEQHFEYHLSVGPGDVLTLTQRKGESWQRQSRRSESLHFQETITDFRNGRGEHVLTSRSVRVIVSGVLRND